MIERRRYVGHVRREIEVRGLSISVMRARGGGADGTRLVDDARGGGGGAALAADVDVRGAGARGRRVPGAGARGQPGRVGAAGAGGACLCARRALGTGS